MAYFQNIKLFIYIYLVVSLCYFPIIQYSRGFNDDLKIIENMKVGLGFFVLKQPLNDPLNDLTKKGATCGSGDNILHQFGKIISVLSFVGYNPGH